MALPANRALPNSILRIDASELSPSLIRRVSGNLRGYGTGGGTEFLFNERIPANHSYKSYQIMNMENRIKTALEFLKDGQSFSDQA